MHKYCIRHGIVEATHRCSPTYAGTTDNQIRASKNKAHGTQTTYWRKLRTQALERDGYRCQLNVDHRCTQAATTVHLDPALKGNHRIAGLEHCKSACKHCHGVEDGRRTPRA
jgi:5-methylcytosine-specific restriction endonuclease McrA